MVQGAEVRVGGNRRALDAYLAEPSQSTGRCAAIVIVHEIFGVDEHTRDVARRFAGEGYVALAPNLFTGPLQEQLTPANIRLAMESLANAPPGLRADPSKFREFAASQPPERRPVLEAFATATNPVTQEGFALDLLGATQYLRHLPNVDPARIGAVGFCFGGAMVGRLATVDPELRAGVIFYGQNPPLDQVPKVRAHLLGLYGGEDPGVTEKVPELAEAAQRAGVHFESHVYPGAKHAFFNDQRPNYDPTSAGDAWPRVLAFYRRELA